MFRFRKEHWFFLVAARDMKHEYALKFWEDMFIVMEGPSLPGWLEQWSPLLPPDKENIRRWKFDWRKLVSPYFHLFSSFRGGCFLQQVCAKVCHCRGVEKEKGGVEVWAEKGCFILKQVFVVAKLCLSTFQRQIALFSPCRSVVTFCQHKFYVHRGQKQNIFRWTTCNSGPNSRVL